jgi:hypothetical protein
MPDALYVCPSFLFDVPTSAFIEAPTYFFLRMTLTTPAIASEP